MKILFVAMAESIHKARWIHQVKDENWELYLFPSHDYRSLRSDFDGLKILVPFFFLFTWLDKRWLGKYFRFIYSKIFYLTKKRSPDYYAQRLD